MQALFQLDVQKDSFLPEVDAYLGERSADADLVAYARRLVDGAWRERIELDRLVTTTVEHWSLDRMAPVDRNVIRVALAEMRFGGDPPTVVIINEAIEIAKAFGSRESGPFVNAILDAIATHWRDGTDGGGATQNTDASDADRVS